MPKAETHPNTFAWFVLMHRFSEAIRNSWTGAAPAKAAAKPAAPAKKEEPKKEEPKKEAAKADDDMDLFGDSDEEDAVSNSCDSPCGGVAFILNLPAPDLFSLCALYLIGNLIN